MAVQYKIRVTKAVLEKSMNCGNFNHIGPIEENCAVAISLQHIFPMVRVTKESIHPFGRSLAVCNPSDKIELPKIARDFINVFDSLTSVPHLRLLLPEIEFEISIPDLVISQIDIAEIDPFLCKEEIVLAKG